MLFWNAFSWEIDLWVTLGDFTVKKKTQNWEGKSVFNRKTIKGCGMGTLFRFAFFRENIVITSKIVCFLFSLDNLLQKNVIVFFFENQISKWRSLKGYFWPTFHIFSHQLQVIKLPSAHISLTYIHTCILLTLLTSLPYQFWKKKRISRVWFLFGVSPGVDSYSRHFGTINK